MKIMNGYETLDYFMTIVKNKKRIAFSRYGDGEYFLMAKKRLCATETFETGDLLRESLTKGQFICTAHFDKDYDKLIINKTQKWANTQRYVMEHGNRELYGTGSFMRRDFMGKCQLIPAFFAKRVLIVSGHSQEAKQAFKNEGIDIDVYPMPKGRASNKYKQVKKFLVKKGNSYNNIIFSCGPIAKVLVADMFDKCDSNLIDFGSMLNIILSKHYKHLQHKWSISWARNIDIDKLNTRFFDNVRQSDGE